MVAGQNKHLERSSLLFPKSPQHRQNLILIPRSPTALTLSRAFPWQNDSNSTAILRSCAGRSSVKAQGWTNKHFVSYQNCFNAQGKHREHEQDTPSPWLRGMQ